mmetsp:Transcript_6837/g.14648  ORF Transcript_6837/g.14648 Transcript_6837/m.14648 type:complete len:266 (-) Transcript_6837:1825-2622(-)
MTRAPAELIIKPSSALPPGRSGAGSRGSRPVRKGGASSSGLLPRVSGDTPPRPRMTGESDNGMDKVAVPTTISGTGAVAAAPHLSSAANRRARIFTRAELASLSFGLLFASVAHIEVPGNVLCAVLANCIGPPGSLSCTSASADCTGPVSTNRIYSAKAPPEAGLTEAPRQKCTSTAGKPTAPAPARGLVGTPGSRRGDVERCTTVGSICRGTASPLAPVSNTGASVPSRRTFPAKPGTTTGTAVLPVSVGAVPATTRGPGAGAG